MQFSRSAVLALRDQGAPSSSLEVMRTGVVPPTRSLEATYSDHDHSHQQQTLSYKTGEDNMLEDTEELVSLMRKDLEWMVSETRAALEANNKTRTAIDNRNDALREHLLKEVGRSQQHHQNTNHGIKRVVSSHSNNDPHQPTTTTTSTRQASPSLPPSYETVLQDHDGGLATHHHQQQQPSSQAAAKYSRYVVGLGPLESPPRPTSIREGLLYEHPHQYNPPAGADTSSTSRLKPPTPPTTRPSPLSTYFEEEGDNEPQPSSQEGPNKKKMFQMEFSPPSRAPSSKGNKQQQQHHQVRRPVLTSELLGLRREYEAYATPQPKGVASNRRGSSERATQQQRPKRSTPHPTTTALAATPAVVVGAVPPQSTYRADTAFERPSTTSIAQLRAQQPEVAAPNRRAHQQQQHHDPTPSSPVPVERISLAPRRVDGHQPISPQPTSTTTDRTPSGPHVVDLSPQLSPPRGGSGMVGGENTVYDAAQYSGPVRNNNNNPPVPARTFAVDGHQRAAVVRSPERLIYAPPVTQSMMRDSAEHHHQQQPPPLQYQPHYYPDISSQPTTGGPESTISRNKPSPQQQQHQTPTNTKVVSLGNPHHHSTSRESSVLSPRQPSKEWLEKAALDQKELTRTFDAVYEVGPPRRSTTEQWVDTHIQFETACGLQRQQGVNSGSANNTSTRNSTTTSRKMSANIQSPRPSNHHHRPTTTTTTTTPIAAASAVVSGSSSPVAALREQQHHTVSSSSAPKQTSNHNIRTSSYHVVGSGGGGSTTSTVRRMMSPLKQ